MIWRKIEPNVWKPQKEGDFIEGVLMDKMPRDGDISARYFLMSNGDLKMVWGSSVLDDRMRFADRGSLLRITFVKEDKNKRNQRLHIYQVEVAENNQK